MMSHNEPFTGRYDGARAEGDGSSVVAPFGPADLAAVGTIVGLWTLMAIVVNPVGDFPLNDDWAYGLPVKWLVETGRLRFTDWSGMTLITQVFWGALFASIAGFSFTVLRISTLVMATVGLAASYLLGREAGLPRWLAMVVTGLFLVNPIFISVSHSFMTDVPFWALTMLAVFLLLRGMRRGHAVSYWAGWAAILAATLLRQLGAAIPIGLVIALALKDGLSRSYFRRVLVPALAVVAVVAAYPKVMQATIGLSATYARAQGSLVQVFGELIHLRLGALKPLLYGIGCALMHLGWWMLPLLVALPAFRGASERPHRVSVRTLIAMGSAAVVTVVLFATGRLMPVGSAGCILIDFGTGPRAMAGEVPHAPVLLWVGVTAVSAFGATLLVLNLASIARKSIVEILATRDFRPHWLPAFLIIVGAVYCVPWAYYGPWFDRYLLLEMSVLGLLIAGEAAKSAGRGMRPSVGRVTAAAVLGLMYLGFGVASTHDYLAWNRSRWEAARSLVSTGEVAPTDVEGGFEVQKYLPLDHVAFGKKRAHIEDPETSFLVSKVASEPQYVVALSESPGFTVVRRLPVDRWMFLSPREVVILRHRPADRPSP
jgi:hypothetical protein